MLFCRMAANRLFSVLLILFHLFSFVSCTTKGVLPAEPVHPDDPAIVPLSRSVKWWIQRHNDRLNVKYNQKIIFIGDSITQGWEYSELWAELNQQYNFRITNLGFSGDQTQHVIWRLENGEFPPGINPEYVVLMIGTNNKHEPKSIAAGIAKIIMLIHNASPATKIILLSLLPCGTGNDDQNTIKNNMVNTMIKKYNGYCNVKYYDLGQFYVDKKGQLIEKLFTDSLHLSAEGYALWREKLTEMIDTKR